MDHVRGFMRGLWQPLGKQNMEAGYLLATRTAQMPKAYIHVGTMKTGTTSIQAALKQNNDILAEQAVHYLNAWPLRRSEKVAPLLAKLSDDAEKVVMSDEGIWHFAREDRLANTRFCDLPRIAKLFANFDVSVIVYMRRPDEMLQSWFLQGMKSGTGSRNFSSFLNSPFVAEGMHFLPRLEMFERHFGEGSVVVRPYERSQFINGDVIADFCDVLGVDRQLLQTAKRKNVTHFSTDRALLSSMIFGMPTKKDEHIQKISKPFFDILISNGLKMRDYSLFTKDELTAIEANFRPVFEEIQNRYKSGAGQYFFKDWIDVDGFDEKTDSLRPLQEALEFAKKAGVD